MSKFLSKINNALESNLIFLLFTAISLIAPTLELYKLDLLDFFIVIIWNMAAGRDAFKNNLVLIFTIAFVFLIPVFMTLNLTAHVTYLATFVFYVFVVQIIKKLLWYRNVD